MQTNLDTIIKKNVKIPGDVKMAFNVKDLYNEINIYT